MEARRWSAAPRSRRPSLSRPAAQGRPDSAAGNPESPATDSWSGGRWVLVTAIAPLAWGASYYVTRHLLPVDSPLWGATLRALPAALVLLALARTLPRGAWIWRSVVLGLLNVGVFFVLVYLAAQWLPSGIAASIMAISPLTLAGMSWLLVGERPAARMLAGAVLGIVGVWLLVTVGTGELDWRGVLASLAALVLSSTGYVLTKRWQDDTPVLAVTAWQLLAGGLGLVLAALAVEGVPPALDPPAVAGFAFLSLIATALAFVCWFTGLARLSAGTVGIVGLLNPVTGLLLGAFLAGERLTLPQLAGVGLVLAGILLGRQGASAPTGAQRAEDASGIGGPEAALAAGAVEHRTFAERRADRRHPDGAAAPAAGPAGASVDVGVLAVLGEPGRGRCRALDARGQEPPRPLDECRQG
jgi:probable blue pigment (indigoidine) exporter